MGWRTLRAAAAKHHELALAATFVAMAAWELIEILALERRHGAVSLLALALHSAQILLVAGVASAVIRAWRARTRHEEALERMVETVVMAQEEERRRIAYDVHDGIAQLIVSAKQHVETCRDLGGGQSERAARELAKAAERLRGAVVETRRVLAALRPSAVDSLGLAEAIRRSLDEAAQEDAGWSTRFSDGLGDVRLAPAVETAVFRIVQETLANAGMRIVAIWGLAAQVRWAIRVPVRLKLALCGALLALLANGGALGQEPSSAAAPPPPPGPDEPLARLPAVQVIAPPLGETFWRPATPASVNTMTGRDIERERPSVLPDALQILPGVTLQNEQGTPFQPDLTLRGFVVSPVTGIPQGLSVYLDGVRLNEPTVEEVNFDLIPLEIVERVEVIRGPSVLFGRNTLGGAITLVTRRGSEAREIIPQIQGGSFGRRDFSLFLGDTSKPLDYLVSLRYTAENGYRDDSDARLARGVAKLGFSRGDTDVAVSYQYSNDNIKQPGSLPESELSVNRRANFTGGDFFAPELNLAIVNAEHHFGEQLTANLNAFVRSLRATQFNANLIAPNSTLNNTTLSVGGGLQGTYKMSIAGQRNVLIAGMEYTHSYVTSKTFEQEEEGQELEADLTDTQNAVGAYIQDSLTLFSDFAGPGSNVVLTAAGRYDFLSQDIDDLLGGDSGGRFTFQKLNPRVGVNVNLSDRFGVYASYGQGFRAPSFLELTCAGPGAVCPGLQVGVAPDPPLNPVTAQNYEIGVYGRPFPWLDVEVVGYWTNVQDDIFAVSPLGTTGVFFQNIGNTRRQGIEVTLRGRWGRALDAYLNYGYTLATFQSRAELATPLPPGTETVQPGDIMPLVPRNRLNLGVNYRPWSWLTVSAEGLFVGSQYFRGDPSNAQAPLSPYFVVNAGATARWRGLEGFVRINNLLNNQYETFGTYAVNGRAPGHPVEPFVTPAPPINVLVGLLYRF